MLPNPTTTPIKKTLYRAETRGQADHGWIKTHFSFSFATHHDPYRMNFGVLRVLNDDVIAAGRGFGMHPHQNMEIITIPTGGVVQHRDNLGHEGTITPGEVQVMSAGRGIHHAEYNGSATEPLTLFQIWVLPDEAQVEPRYDQKRFDSTGQQGQFQLLVHPEGEGDGLWIHQNAYFSRGSFDAHQEFSYALRQPTNGLYVFVVEGEVQVAGETLHRRDALGLEGLPTVSFKTNGQSAGLLLLDVPMQ